MYHHRKADIADALGHARADVLPELGRPVEAVDAAMVLLIEPVRHDRMQAHAVRIMAEIRRWLRQEIRFDARVERAPIRARVGRFEYASARHADIHVIAIARVDQDRMELGSVRRSVLVTAAPCLAHRVLVEAVDAVPRRAAVLGAKQPLRRRAHVPSSRLRRVSRREPEAVIDDTSAALPKRWRTFRLVPRPPAIGRAEDGGAQVTCASCRKQDLAVARVGDAMMDDVAEKMRAGKAPYTAGRIGIELPQTLARRNEQRCAPPPRVVELCHLALPTSGPQKLRLRIISHKTPAQYICL